MIEVPLGEYLPDAGEWLNPGLTIANNVYPVANGYAPFYAANGSGDTTTETVQGAATFFKTDGSQLLAFGSSTRLGIRTASGVTETTGLTAIGSTAYWRFARFGDQIIAVSLNNAPQYLDDIDTDTSWSALPGSPPNAAVVGRIANQLFLGHVTESSVTYPSRIRWSAVANATTGWTTNRGELSDFRDLPEEYGAVTAIVGNRSGLVFQERAIWRATFVGTPLGWDFDLLISDKGCIAAGSVVEIGADVYFLAEDGFYRTDGTALYPLSEGKISTTFLDGAQAAILPNVAAAVDWYRRAVVWAYQQTPGGAFTRQVIYSLVNDRWSTATEVMDYPVASQVDATTLGDLGSAVTAYGDVTLGNPAWGPKEQTLGVFIASGAGSEFAQLTGDAKVATFKTGYGQPAPGRRQRITDTAALVDVADLSDVTISVAVRDHIGGTDRTSERSPAADTLCHHNLDGRYASLALALRSGASWSKATAFQVNSGAAGRR